MAGEQSQNPKASDKQKNQNQKQKDQNQKDQKQKETKSDGKGTSRTRSQGSIDSYNPFEHRNVAKPTSDFGALAHLLKTSLGSGILAMPMAFKNAGLAFGAVGTVCLGIICTHCVQLLVRTSQVVCRRKRIPTLNYPETAEFTFETGPPKVRVFAKTMRITILTELLLSFILGNTVYVVFMSQSMYQVVEFYFNFGIDIRLYILMLWIPLILMCMFRNLKSLVPFSIIANCFVVVSFAITLYYIFRDIRHTSSVKMIASADRLPLFLTTVIFAIEGIGTVLPIENEMRTPEHFLGGRCGIIYVAMTIVVAVYGIIGFFGYLEYGEDTRGSITLNLPVKDSLAQAVKILIALAIFFTYALQFYVPINLIWDLIKPKVAEKYHLWANNGVRIGLVSLTIIASLVIPNLEPIISLVGAICFSMLGLFFPSLLDIVVRWPKAGCLHWRIIKNIFIIILSVVALVSGTYASVLDIMSSYF